MCLFVRKASKKHSDMHFFASLLNCICVTCTRKTLQVNSINEEQLKSSPVGGGVSFSHYSCGTLIKPHLSVSSDRIEAKATLPFMFVNPSSLIQAMTTLTVDVHVFLKPFAVFKEHLVQCMLELILGFRGC